MINFGDDVVSHENILAVRFASEDGLALYPGYALIPMPRVLQRRDEGISPHRAPQSGRGGGLKAKKRKPCCRGCALPGAIDLDAEVRETSQGCSYFFPMLLMLSEVFGMHSRVIRLLHTHLLGDGWLSLDQGD